ncbi:hypothetical protein EfmAA818_18580 [Enterococcus faecium]|nr:hypothetical protein EfmAA818_18580 [Enterococcus faecium]
MLKRNFSVDTPNKKWVTDVTEFKIKGRKIYLSPILDLFNGEIISYSIYATNEKGLSMAGLNFSGYADYKEIQEGYIQIKDGSIRCHNIKKIKENNIIQSMSRKGNCLDKKKLKENNIIQLCLNQFFYREKFFSIFIEKNI